MTKRTTNHEPRTMNYNAMRKIFVICFLSFVFVLSVFPLFVSAQTTPTMPNIWPSGYWGGGGLVSCTGLGGGGKPACTSLCDIFQTMENVLAFGETIALFIAAPVLFVWGGIIIMTAGANPSGIQQGKKILTGTLIGILIVLFAYLIIATIVNVLIPSAGQFITGFSGSNPFTCTP